MSEGSPRHRTVHTDEAPAPVAGAPYRQAVVATPGPTVFISGQVPVDPATGALVADDITAQTRRALQNLLAVLSAAGGAPRDLVKTTIFMTDLGEFPTVNEIYREVLGAEPPARATVQVAALPLGARIEIDGIAVLPPA